MSDYSQWEDDLEDSGETNAMKYLREAYKKAQKQNKEMAERLEQLQSSLRERSVKDVIASKGLPEKVAALIPKDITSSEDVENWINEYGEIFGVQAQSSTEGQPATPSPELQALSRIAGAQSTGQPFSGDATQLDALIRSAQTPEELNKILFGSAAGPQAS